MMEYDGFSAVCTGSKDSDSPDMSVFRVKKVL